MAGASTPESASAIAARVGLELFRCEPFTLTMTRRGCAVRWRAAQSEDCDPRIVRCRSCAVGAAHAEQHPDAAAPPARKRRRKSAFTEGSIAAAQARKAKSAPSGGAATPSNSRPAGPPASAAPKLESLVEAPVSAPACASMMEAHETDDPTESPVERRPRGAPPPRASDDGAEAFRERLRTDEGERERVLALIDGAVFGTPAARRAARACALRRVAGLPLAVVINELGAEDLDEAGAAVLVSRGRWVVARGLRQHRLDEAPGERAALDAIAPLVLALLRAERSDAGRPRPAARGPRKTIEPRRLPILEALERGAA